MFFVAKFIWKFFLPTLNLSIIEATDTPTAPLSYERSTAAANTPTTSPSPESPTLAGTPPQISSAVKSFSFADTLASFTSARTTYEKPPLQPNEELDNILLEASTITLSQPSAPRVTAGNRRVALAQQKKSSEGLHFASLPPSSASSSSSSSFISDHNLLTTLQSRPAGGGAQASTDDRWVSEMFSYPALQQGYDPVDAGTQWPMQAPQTSERKVKGLPRRARSGPGIQTTASVTVSPPVVPTIPATQPASYPTHNNVVNSLQYALGPSFSSADCGVVDYTGVSGSYASSLTDASGLHNEEAELLLLLSRSGQSAQPELTYENVGFSYNNNMMYHNDQYSGVYAPTTGLEVWSASSNDDNFVQPFYSPALEFDGQNWVPSSGCLSVLDVPEHDQSGFLNHGTYNTNAAANTSGYTLADWQDYRTGSDGSALTVTSEQVWASSHSSQDNSGLDFPYISELQLVADALSQEQREKFFRQLTEIVDPAIDHPAEALGDISEIQMDVGSSDGTQASRSITVALVSEKMQDCATIDPQAVVLRDQTDGCTSPPKDTEPLDSSVTTLVEVSSFSMASSTTSTTSDNMYTESGADTVDKVTAVVQSEPSCINDIDELTDADAEGEDEANTESVTDANSSVSSPAATTSKVHSHPQRPRRRSIKRSPKKDLRFEPYPNPDLIKTKRDFVLEAAEVSVQPASCEDSSSVVENAQESESQESESEPCPAAEESSPPSSPVESAVSTIEKDTSANSLPVKSGLEVAEIQPAPWCEYCSSMVENAQESKSESEPCPEAKGSSTQPSPVESAGLVVKENAGADSLLVKSAGSSAESPSTHTEVLNDTTEGEPADPTITSPVQCEEAEDLLVKNQACEEGHGSQSAVLDPESEAPEAVDANVAVTEEEPLTNATPESEGSVQGTNSEENQGPEPDPDAIIVDEPVDNGDAMEDIDDYTTSYYFLVRVVIDNDTDVKMEDARFIDSDPDVLMKDRKTEDDNDHPHATKWTWVPDNQFYDMDVPMHDV